MVRLPTGGTPQGGVISPLLANIYLHVVVDEWFENVVKPRLGGQAELVRYADDFVIVFTREDDARRVSSGIWIVTCMSPDGRSRRMRRARV